MLFSYYAMITTYRRLTDVKTAPTVTLPQSIQTLSGFFTLSHTQVIFMMFTASDTTRSICTSLLSETSSSVYGSLMDSSGVFDKKDI